MRDLRRAALAPGVAALCALASALGSGEAHRDHSAGRPAAPAAKAGPSAAGSAPPLAWTRPAPGAARGAAARAAAVARSRRAQRAARRSLERARAEAMVGPETLEVQAPLRLDPPQPAEDLPALRLAGFDPAAPRAVWLWRVGEGTAALAARGHSQAGGEIVFPRLAIPAGGLRLVATPAGSGPSGPGASQLRDVPGRTPLPRVLAPQGTLQATLEEGEDNHGDSDTE